MEWLFYCSGTSLRYWVGAAGRNKNYIWVVIGTGVLSTLWSPGVPYDLTGTKNCVQLSGSSPGLYEHTCDLQKGFLCEDRFQPGDCCQNCAQSITQANTSFN